MCWLRRASCPLDRDGRGQSRGGGRCDSEPTWGPATNTLVLLSRASGHQHCGQVQCLPFQPMQEQRDMYPGSRGAVPLRLPLRLQGMMGGSAPYHPRSREGHCSLLTLPSPRTVDKSTSQVTPKQHLPATLPFSPALLGAAQLYPIHTRHRGPHVVSTVMQ